MATEAVETWRRCFQNWPPDIERRGVVVTSWDEQIIFEGFATSDDILLLDRRTPDTLGARQVLLPYGNIQGLKIIDVVKMKAYQPLGFSSPPPKK